MASEPVDTVSVALEADLRPLLQQLDEGVEKAVEAGQKIGVGFGEGLSEEMRRLAEDVEKFSRDMGLSLEEGAEFFSRWDMAAGRSAEELLAIVEQFGAQSAARLQEANEAVQVITESFEMMGKALTDEQVAKLEELAKAAGQLSEEGDEAREKLLSLADAARESLDEWKFMQEEIARVSAALVEMGQAAPDAVQREKIENYMQSLFRLNDSAQQARQEVRQFGDQLINNAKAQQQAVDINGLLNVGLNVLRGNLSGVVGQLAGAVGAAAGFVVGFREVVHVIQDAVDLSIKYEDSITRLAVAQQLFANQAVESTVIFDDWVQQICELSLRFGIAETTLADASRTLLLLLQGSNLTQEEMMGLTEAGTAMAIVMDRDVASTLRALALFINTGFPQALRRLGISFTDAQLNATATGLGFQGLYKDLDEASQQLVRYTLVQQEANGFIEAASAIQETSTQQLQQAKIEYEASARILGDIFAPALVKAKIGLQQAGTAAVEVFAGGLLVVIKVLIRNTAILLGLVDATAKFTAGQINSAEEFMEAWRSAAQVANDALLATFAEATLGRALSAADKAAKAVKKAMREMAEGTKGPSQEAIDAFTDMALEFDQASKDIERRFAETMQQIQQDAENSRRDAEIGLQRDLRDIDEAAAEDRLQTIQDYQTDEIRLREDHQIAVRRLEEDFLLNLEDAVRERDARRVLQLQRQFNLQKQRLDEDYEVQRRRRRQEFQLELEDIERQRQLRRAQRFQDFQDELADIEAQRLLKEQQAKDDATRERQRLLDSIRDRLEILRQGWVGELAMTNDALLRLYQAYSAAFGPGGWLEDLYNYASGIIAGGAAQLAGAQAPALPGGTTATSPFTSPYHGRQRGGSLIATSPMALRVGEGRPERVDITPLSTSTGAPAAGFREGTGEPVRIMISVDASEMLVAEVVDQSMSEVADVLVEMARRGHQGTPK